MQDPYDYEISVNPGYGKKRFSQREIGDIAISMAVLSVAMMMLYRNGTIMSYLDYMCGPNLRWGALFGICLLLVFCSFLLHEFGHKFVAQKYGMWSEFRMFPMGLVLTIVTSMMGFLFAAPGAVYIRGYADVKRNGHISIAGPAVNIVIAGIAIAVLAVIDGGNYMIDEVQVPVFLICMMLASLNAFLALFNLIPLGPLDGGKILAWDKVVWIAAFALAALELVYIYAFLPDFTIWIPRA